MASNVMLILQSTKVKNIAYFKLNLKQVSKFARMLKRLYILIKSKNIQNTLQFHNFRF